MKKEEKIWIIFLAHLYYEIEVKTILYLSRNLAILEPIITMWDSFGPKLISVWRNGESYLNLEDSGDYHTNILRNSLLCLDYNSYTPHDVFIKVFGLDIQQSYCHAVHMNMAKLIYKIENGEMFYFNGNVNFHFKDGVIKPYFAAHGDEANRERLKNGFDKNFLAFFEEHIGSDFSGAENFFEVYVRSKLKKVTVEDYRKELREYFEWFLPISKEYSIDFKHEILTKANIEIFNKAKEWSKKIRSMEKRLNLTEVEIKKMEVELSQGL